MHILLEKQKSFFVIMLRLSTPTSAFARIADAVAGPRFYCRVHIVCRAGRFWVGHRQTKTPLGLFFLPSPCLALNISIVHASPPSTSHLSHSVGFYTDTGDDDPQYGTGRPFNNRFYDNTISDTDVAIKLKKSDRISIKSEEGWCCVIMVHT